MPRPRPPTHEQLRAIARRVHDSDPTEWRERIKLALVAQRCALPPPHVISAAMDAVERVLAKQAPRQRSLLDAPRPPAPPEDRPLSHVEACAALAHLAQRLGPLPALKPRAMPTGDSELMTTRERYAVVHDIERLRTILRLRRANREHGNE